MREEQATKLKPICFGYFDSIIDKHESMYLLVLHCRMYYVAQVDMQKCYMLNHSLRIDFWGNTIEYFRDGKLNWL